MSDLKTVFTAFCFSDIFLIPGMLDLGLITASAKERGKKGQNANLCSHAARRILAWHFQPF